MHRTEVVQVVCSCEHGNETVLLINKYQGISRNLVWWHPKTDSTSLYYTDLGSVATQKFI
jgi:hypothetical protein